MKALLLTVGSEGDVRPMMALGSRLQREGHEVVLAAPRLFRPLAIAAEVPFAPLDLDMTRVVEATSGVHGTRHLVRFAMAMGSLVADAIAGLSAAVADSDRSNTDDRSNIDDGSGIDVVVHHPVLPLGHHVAEHFGVPAVVALPLPALVPTEAFASPVWSRTNRFPGAVNRASYRLTRQLTGVRCWAEIDRWRTDTLGLPRRPDRHDPLRAPDGGPVPVLHGFSRHVLPPPADWPEAARVTGYWFLPTPPHWAPSRKLASFLDAGDPPVYIGFGSMPIADPRKLNAIVTDAVERIGARAIVAAGYHGLRGMTPSKQILVIRNAPHDWLFPRVRAVVHHGGAGTTGAAAAAGRPQVICPIGFDQPFWAERMCLLGVAAPAPRLRELTGPSLERALRRVLDDRDIREAADALGGRIRAEDGPGLAVSFLERVVAGAGAVAANAGRR